MAYPLEMIWAALISLVRGTFCSVGLDAHCLFAAIATMRRDLRLERTTAADGGCDVFTRPSRAVKVNFCDATGGRHAERGADHVLIGLWPYD